MLDRVTGEFLQATAFARQTWNKGFDAKGRPIPRRTSNPLRKATASVRVLPARRTGWLPPIIRRPDCFYFTVREACDVYFSSPPKYVEGQPFLGSVVRGVTEEREWGVLKAIDPLSGQTKWEFRLDKAPWAGTLSTSGGLVFAGDEDGYFMAADAKTGKILWRIYTGTRLVTSPMTYMLDGRQYIVMPSGAAVLTFALPKDTRP